MRERESQSEGETQDGRERDREKERAIETETGCEREGERVSRLKREKQKINSAMKWREREGGELICTGTLPQFYIVLYYLHYYSLML